MAVCASRRECWLWGAAALVVLLIFSTIPVAADLFAFLDDRELIDGLFGIGFSIAVLALIGVATFRRPGWREIAVVLGIVAVAVTLVARVSLPAERTHLFEYAVLGAVIYLALLERDRHRSAPAPAVTAFLITAGIGLVDEVLQSFVPGRYFDWRDVAFNVVASLFGVCAVAAVRWARRSST